MKKISTIILSLLFAAVFTLPIFASAATSPGVKPGSFFYFFDTSFEKIGLFFTFNPEKKARRALQYADERLAEIEVIAEEKDADAVKTAISNYENNVALAAEKSKEVTDKAKAENLLTVIEDNAAKNQEVLSVVLTKVPEEAREAILRAISASRKGQEEAAKQIIALKGEVEKLKQEVEELKKESNDPRAEEVEKLKKEVEELKKKHTSPAPIQKNTEPAKQTNTEEDNFWELAVTTNAEYREKARKYKEVISDDPYYLQSRLDELDNNIRIIRNTYFANASGDTATFNEMFKLLEDSYQNERTYVQNVLDNTNKRIKYLDGMVAYYDGKVNYYIKLPIKFVNRETWIADAEAYVNSQSDMMYKAMSVSIEDFGNFVNNMKKQDEEYYGAISLIKKALENYDSSYSSYIPTAPKTDYSYYDRVASDLYSKPSILNPITCNITGKDVLGNQTVTCY